MKNYVKKFLFISLSVLISFIVIELVLFILLSTVYKNFNKPKLFADIYDKALQGQELSIAGHPYFSFVLSEHFSFYDDTADEFKKLKVNNYGFSSSFDFPVLPKKGELRIGIFGGSVAFELGNFLELINKDINESLKNGNIKLKFLNFGLPSTKQPQQFFISSYFLSSVDVGINLDGFNEVNTFSYPSVPIEYPSYSPALLFNNKEYFNLLVNNLNKKKTFKRFMDTFSVFIKNSNIGISLALIYNRWTEYGDRKVNQAVPELNFKHKGKIKDELEVLEASVEIWSKYTSYQKALFASERKKLLVIPQPNLYLQNKKQLTLNEKRLREIGYVKAESKIGMIQRYSTFIKRAFELQPQAIDILDIYNNFPSDAYRDSCCHLTEKANLMLAKKIVEILEKKVLKGYNEIQEK
ncbi:MAG: hypothetical protein CME62_03215 [Halobacteriovoraceae bacterium]|nr:hypothetical protein [Halobacteriovoraceae bacterium]|tara:strand:+ start:1870 stop:3099 length:1230 start_codon:yes stop_codon:yes gene_type:complete